MVPGEAVLLHGTLPPIHLTAIRYWEEPDLAELFAAGEAPTTATCPLTDKAITDTEHHPVDIATLEAAKQQLPAPKPTPGATSDGAIQPGRTGKDGTGQMALPCHVGRRLRDGGACRVSALPRLPRTRRIQGSKTKRRSTGVCPLMPGTQGSLRLGPSARLRPPDGESSDEPETDSGESSPATGSPNGESHGTSGSEGGE